MTKIKIFLPLVTLVFLSSYSLYAGTMRKDNKFWDITIYEVKDPKQADIVVYQVKHFEESQGEDYLWKWEQFGKTAVKFVDAIDEANLVVYFTQNKREAGWKRIHPLKGKLLE